MHDAFDCIDNIQSAAHMDVADATQTQKPFDYLRLFRFNSVILLKYSAENAFAQ